MPARSRTPENPHASAASAVAAALAALVLVALVAGCTASGGTTGGTGSTPATAPAPPDAAALTAPNWVATAIAGSDGKLAPVVPGSKVLAKFADNHIEGSGGVNRYNATYALSGTDGISITMGMSTQMAGPPALMTQETAYFSALGKAAKFVVSGKKLELFDSSGSSLVQFVAAEPVTLTGQKWYCLGFNNGRNAVVSLEASSEITAVFGTDGTLQGNAGINDYLTHYTVSGTLMRINPSITSTLKAGPDALMKQETEYLQALKNVSSFKINSDGSLDLFDKAMARQAHYTTTKP